MLIYMYMVCNVCDGWGSNRLIFLLGGGGGACNCQKELPTSNKKH